MDLNLHLPTQADIVSEQQEREVLVRTVFYHLCTIKLTILLEPNKNVDYLLQHGSLFLCSTRETNDNPGELYDSFLCGLVSTIQIQPPLRYSSLPIDRAHDAHVQVPGNCLRRCE